MTSRQQLVEFGRLATTWEVEHGPIDDNPNEGDFHAKARQVLNIPEPGTAPARVPYTRGGRPI